MENILHFFCTNYDNSLFPVISFNVTLLFVVGIQSAVGRGPQEIKEEAGEGSKEKNSCVEDYPRVTSATLHNRGQSCACSSWTQNVWAIEIMNILLHILGKVANTPERIDLMAQRS